MPSMATYFLDLLASHSILIIFLGSFFFGETVIISAAYATAQGVWSLPMVYIVAFIGTITADIIWFLGGQRLAHLTKRWARYQTQYEKLIVAIQKITHGRPFLIMLVIKFLYGTRILTILFLSTSHVRLRTFILFDCIGTLIWLAVMISIGWLAGKSIINIVPFLNTIEFAVTLVIIILVAIRFGTKWLEKKIIASK